MKFQRECGLILVLILVTAGTLVARQAQQAAPLRKDAVAQADNAIFAEIRDHNEIMSNLEYLSDMIGQRLTGSENLKKANDWTRQRFADYGLQNPHLEGWTIQHGWTRGTARGRVLSPAEHPLAIASYGWAPGTGGPVSGLVVYVKGESLADLEAYRGKLKGAIVLATLQDGLAITGVSANPYNIVLGGAIIVAMIANVQLARRRAAGRT